MESFQPLDDVCNLFIVVEKNYIYFKMKTLISKQVKFSGVFILQMKHYRLGSLVSGRL